MKKTSTRNLKEALYNSQNKSLISEIRVLTTRKYWSRIET